MGGTTCGGSWDALVHAGTLGTVGPVPPTDRTLLPLGARWPAAAVAVLAATGVAVLALQYAGDRTAGRVDGHLDRAVDALPAAADRFLRAAIVLGSPPSSPPPPGCSRSSAWWPADPALRCSRSGGRGSPG